MINCSGRLPGTVSMPKKALSYPEQKNTVFMPPNFKIPSHSANGAIIEFVCKGDVENLISRTGAHSQL